MLVSSMLAVLAGFFLLTAKMRTLTKGSAAAGDVLRTTGLFSLLVIIALAAYPLAYPFSDKAIRRSGGELIFDVWVWFVVLSVPTVIVTGGVLLPRAIVKGFGTNGFSPQRYKLSVAAVCGSMLIPCALLAAENCLSPVPQEFRLLDASTKALVLCAPLAVGVFTTVIMCEKAMRRDCSGGASKTRSFAALGMLVSAELMISGLYNFILFIVGDYNECPCELEDYAAVGAERFALSAVILSAALIFMRFGRSFGKSIHHGEQ